MDELDAILTKFYKFHTGIDADGYTITEAKARLTQLIEKEKREAGKEGRVEFALRVIEALDKANVPHEPTVPEIEDGLNVPVTSSQEYRNTAQLKKNLRELTFKELESQLGREE